MIWLNLMIKSTSIDKGIKYNKNFDSGESNFFTDSESQCSMLVDALFGGCEGYVLLSFMYPLMQSIQTVVKQVRFAHIQNQK